MTRLTTILCGLAAALALFCGEARAEKRVALVIGNGDYATAGKLANPVNDATAMAELFRKAGFEVVDARFDLGNLEFKRMVREFTTTARDADIAVLYYAGHGIEVNGVNYLIPVDAKLASDFDVEDEALSLDRLLRVLEPVKRLRLIILDACRDNPFARTMQRSLVSRSAPVTGLAKVEPAQSDTLVAFAARANSTAEDGAGANSPFTTALLHHLAEPGRDIRIALGFVRDEVLKATRNKQEPFVYGSLGGATVALVPEKVKAAPPPVTQAVPQPLAADPRRDYELAERVGTREAWDSFLTLHPSGFYADLARAQRDKLAVAPAPAPDDSKPAISVLPPPALPAAPVQAKPEAKPESKPEAKSVEPAPKEVAPKETAPKQVAPKEVAPKPVAPKQAARPREPSPRVKERPRNRERQQQTQRPARASCPPGSSPFSQGGRMCCEFTPLERGAPRIFCP